MLKYKFDVEPESPEVLHAELLKPFTVFLVNGGRLGMQRGNRIEYRVHGGVKGKSVTINMKTGELCKTGRDQYSLFLRMYLRHGGDFIRKLNQQANAAIKAGSAYFIIKDKVAA